MSAVVHSVVMNEFTHDNRVLNEAHTLARHGYIVRVLALHLAGLDESDEVEGIPVTRVRLRTRDWPRVLMVQLVKYVEWVWRTVRAVRAGGADIVHCNDLAALPIGVTAKALSGGRIRVVYDAHEYETEMNGLRGTQKLLAKIGERALVRWADAVITVSPTIGDEYVRLYGIAPPSIVLNCPRGTGFAGDRDHFRRALGIRADQRIFLYQGALGAGRGIEIVVEAFERMPSDRDVVMFMGFGELEPWLREVSARCETVFFHPAVKPDALLEYTASADVGIALIEDISLSDRYCLPNKLFEYLAVGLPVICSNLPEMARFIAETRVGVVAPSSTPQGLVDAVRAIGALDRACLKADITAARARYNWVAQERVLLGLYRGLMA